MRKSRDKEKKGSAGIRSERPWPSAPGSCPGKVEKPGYFESGPHQDLRLKAAHTRRIISGLVNDAARNALREDQENLAAFRESPRQRFAWYRVTDSESRKTRRDVAIFAARSANGLSLTYTARRCRAKGAIKNEGRGGSPHALALVFLFSIFYEATMDPDLRNPKRKRSSLSLPLYPRRAALGEGSDLFHRCHGRVAREGGEQRAVGPAQLDRFLGILVHQDAVE